VSGTLAWGPAADAGTKKRREAAIGLRGGFAVRWRPYSAVGGHDFRFIVIEIGQIK
jgi:hypothetical protein